MAIATLRLERQESEIYHVLAKPILNGLTQSGGNMGLYGTCTYIDYNRAGVQFFTAFGATHMGLYQHSGTSKSTHGPRAIFTLSLFFSLLDLLLAQPH